MRIKRCGRTGNLDYNKKQFSVNTYRVGDCHMNKAVHYSWAQLVHDLYHGLVIILEGRTIIESLIFIMASYSAGGFTDAALITAISWPFLHTAISKSDLCFE